METVNLDTAVKKIERLSEQKFSFNLSLPYPLFEKRENKTTKLVASSDSNAPMQGASRWFKYSFSEPVFLTEISVLTEKYHGIDKFEFRWVSIDGVKEERTIQRGDDSDFTAPINQLVSSIEFKPPKKWFTDVKILAVDLQGFQQHELKKFTALVGNLERRKDEIQSICEQALENAEQANVKINKLKAEEDEFDKKISNKSSEITDLNNNIGRLTEERNALYADITARKKEVSELQDRLNRIGDNIGVKEKERSGLETDISSAHSELRELKSNIDLFPAEISEFVNQGSKNILTYLKLAAVPIILLVVVTVLLVSNAANLTTVLDENENAIIWSILVTRLPYVILASGILTVAYKLTSIFIAEIMRINRQRLNLSKISIIATDVSNSSAHGLNGLSDERLVEIRTQLKMEMLRDHLKEYLSDDFSPFKETSQKEEVQDVANSKKSEVGEEKDLEEEQ
ncbi:hypothetical protein [Pseudovibrio sp. Ad13]|uniref:hypothetical protein n=1 Tax=Pseudovibrio sp. Ad13 TaxID=989396 RepID=UPI0007AE5C45|nr:hypothetical protein [Pseudovibrio sp. Ad13]